MLGHAHGVFGSEVIAQHKSYRQDEHIVKLYVTGFVVVHNPQNTYRKHQQGKTNTLCLHLIHVHKVDHGGYDYDSPTNAHKAAERPGQKPYEHKNQQLGYAKIHYLIFERMYFYFQAMHKN